MVISCGQCGRSVCEIQPLEVSRAEGSIVRRVLSGFGVDLGDELEVVINPTPEKITEVFKVRCPNGCG